MIDAVFQAAIVAIIALVIGRILPDVKIPLKEQPALATPLYSVRQGNKVRVYWTVKDETPENFNVLSVRHLRSVYTRVPNDAQLWEGVASGVKAGYSFNEFVTTTETHDLLPESHGTRPFGLWPITFDGDEIVELGWNDVTDSVDDIEARRAKAIDRISAVNDDFSAKNADIVEVIERNALFSVRHEPTAAFERQRITMSGWNLDTIDIDALETAAADLEVAYRIAVDNAKRLGLDALDDPAMGQRAIKTVALMKGSSVEGERRAAAEALRTMLEVLHLVAPMAEQLAIEQLAPREIAV